MPDEEPDEEPDATHRPLRASAAVLRTGLALSDLALQEFFVGYLTMGGTMTLVEVQEVLRGERDVSALEHDFLAQSLNDHFTARGQDHPVAYAEDLADTETPPAHGTRRI